MSTILADIDNFKQVNDTHGHPVGDAVLREVSNRIGWALRAYDALGRYGGEEFLVVLPACAITNAIQVAERMRSSIADKPITTTAGMLSVTVSFGVCGGGDGRMLDTEALVLAADNALYRAKGAGRNRVVGADTNEATM